MLRMFLTHSRLHRMRLPLGLFLMAALSVGSVWSASAAPRTELIVLPGASSTEGIAVGRGSTFFAGDLFRGDIFRGDLQRGSAELFIDAPDGRLAVGMKVDRSGSLLFVAGGFTGQGYVYDTTTGASLASYQLASPPTTFINDVVMGREGAWFTDSLQPKLYLVPLGPGGTLGVPRTLILSGPAADTSAEFNLNGIVSTPDGSTLIVVNSGKGTLYTVNPDTGASAAIAGVNVPNADGLLLEAGRMFAVQNTDNKVAVIRLSSDLTSGTVEKVITSPQFQVPTTVARHGSQLALVNAKFDTGIPPTATQFEVVIVDS